jgi:hypothetical protein
MIDLLFFAMLAIAGALVLAYAATALSFTFHLV